MECWSNNIKTYELSDKYSIEKAEEKEFSIYESVYGDKTNNRFAVKNWGLRLQVTLDNPFAKGESFYWIKAGEIKIGGVLLEPNVISRFFIIPPFVDIFEILKLLKRLLIKWSDCRKNIYAYQISEDQSHYFEMVGFWADKNKRWMIRPTEIFDLVWDNTVIVNTPKATDNEKIAKLFHESFKDNVDCQYEIKESGKISGYENYLDMVNDYFNSYTEDIVIEASTLIYNKKDKKLVGACLISCFEEWPLIYSIGVDSSYRNKKFATMMIKKALTVLKNKYPVLRLFVTTGNVAESVYYELGFILGIEFRRLYIPAKDLIH